MEHPSGMENEQGIYEWPRRLRFLPSGAGLMSPEMSRLRKNLSAGFYTLFFTGIAATQAGAKGVVLASTELPATGTIITWTKAAAMTGMALKVNSGSRETSGTLDQKQETAATTTILSADKVQFLATRKTTAGTIVIDGQERPSKQPEFLLKDIPVSLERKDGAWLKPTLESGEGLSEAQTKELLDQEAVRSFKEGLGIYGLGEHEAGEKWQIDVSKVLSFAGLDKPAGTISAEFVAIETISGTECATIKLTFDVTGTLIDDVKVHLQGESVTHRSIADRIDLDSKLTGKVDMTASPQPGTTVTVTGPIQTERTNTVKKP
ncbi:MAG: hypothetical protein JWO82_1111 [Akkermansiaceae bacterium]|nr:hypothetical protein [Akkermansiaceae bacterium]